MQLLLVYEKHRCGIHFVILKFVGRMLETIKIAGVTYFGII